MTGRHPHDDFADAIKAVSKAREAVRTATTKVREGGWHLTRVYLPHGVVAHQLSFASSDSPNRGGCCVRCGRTPQRGSYWLGTGSMTEQEKAAALPLCFTRGHVWGGAEWSP